MFNGISYNLAYYLEKPVYAPHKLILHPTALHNSHPKLGWQFSLFSPWIMAILRKIIGKIQNIPVTVTKIYFYSVVVSFSKMTSSPLHMFDFVIFRHLRLFYHFCIFYIIVLLRLFAERGRQICQDWDLFYARCTRNFCDGLSCKCAMLLWWQISDFLMFCNFLC